MPVVVTTRGRCWPALAALDHDTERDTDLYEDVLDKVRWKPAQRRLRLKINVGRRPAREDLLTAVVTSGTRGPQRVQGRARLDQSRVRTFFVPRRASSWRRLLGNVGRPCHG